MVVSRAEEKCSKLEAFFMLNRTDNNASKYTYEEIPQFYVCNSSSNLWTVRKRGHQIGRLVFTHHTSGEVWYLRLLLSKVRGPISFKALRTVNGVEYSTFLDACNEYHFLDNDDEWHEVMSESSLESNVRDFLFTKRRALKKPDLVLKETEIEYYAFAEIDRLLKSIGKYLKDYPQMPQPPSIFLDVTTNTLILEETSYDTEKMEKEYSELLMNCNEDQNTIYNAEKIVLPVASNGIAATLLPNGRTAHSRFKIPIVLNDYSLCNISHNSETAELIKRTSLIFWDEAMQHRYTFECLDRSLRYIMKSIHPQHFNMPFGGITVLLGGNFHQILPVIKYGSRADVVSASITRSR
ncbi:uncharacterized protein LOC141664721 [Apium graveolens]|uniref:uncharacterized protein LOC141664721 n=1 Tax=Apium graveolens TaxID=4045 RepID=UPI003D7B4F3B